MCPASGRISIEVMLRDSDSRATEEDENLLAKEHSQVIGVGVRVETHQQGFPYTQGGGSKTARRA